MRSLLGSVVAVMLILATATVAHAGPKRFTTPLLGASSNATPPPVYCHVLSSSVEIRLDLLLIDALRQGHTAAVVAGTLR